MAHYVMGDIHGEADRFHAMLEKIHFSEEDTLILLGYAIGRGPDGIALLLGIMEMPHVIMVLLHFDIEINLQNMVKFS